MESTDAERVLGGDLEEFIKAIFNGLWFIKKRLYFYISLSNFSMSFPSTFLYVDYTCLILHPTLFNLQTSYDIID